MLYRHFKLNELVDDFMGLFIGQTQVANFPPIPPEFALNPPPPNSRDFSIIIINVIYFLMKEY